MLLKRPITAFMLILGTLIFGTIALGELSVNLLPEVDLPNLMVRTDIAAVGNERQQIPSGSSVFSGGSSHETLRNSDAEFRRYEFRETLRLGEGKPLSREYLMGIPDKLCTDSRGRIYLADGKFAGIRVYDPEGTYLKTIGRSGKGPGEFVDISDMTVTPEDRLVVIDRMQIRVTEFDVSSPEIENLGEVVKTYNHPEKRVVTPIETVALEDGSFAIAYRIYLKWPGEPGPLGPEEMVHFVDPEWEEITHRTFSYDHLGDMDLPYFDFLIGFPSSTLRMAAIDENTVAIAPFFYEGELYLIEKQEDGRWQPTRTVDGFTEHPDAVTYYFDAGSAPEAAHVVGSGGYAAVNHNNSLGLFRTAEDLLVHISFQLFEGKRRVMLEKFNENGELIEYGPVPNLSNYSTQPEQDHMAFQWVDASDQFYLFDYRNLDEGIDVRRGVFEVLE